MTGPVGRGVCRVSRVAGLGNITAVGSAPRIWISPMPACQPFAAPLNWGTVPAGVNRSLNLGARLH